MTWVASTLATDQSAVRDDPTADAAALRNPHSTSHDAHDNAASACGHFVILVSIRLLVAYDPDRRG